MKIRCSSMEKRKRAASIFRIGSIEWMSKCWSSKTVSANAYLYSGAGIDATPHIITITSIVGIWYYPCIVTQS